MNRWKQAQDSEIRCWSNIQSKLVSEEYKVKKLKFWDLVFNKISEKINIDDSKDFADVGCGPSGIVLKYPKKTNLYCIDPLLDEYCEVNPYLKKTEAKMINSKIEDITIEYSFDYIFGFNSLDHVDSIQESIKSLKRLLKDDGLLVVSMNCHNYGFMRKILQKTNFIFDRPHPHQYSLQDYIRFLEEEGLEVLDTINLDDEISFMNNKYNDKIGLKQIIKKILHPFIFLNICGVKRYGGKDEKTIYSSSAIIARRFSKQNGTGGKNEIINK